MGCFELPLPIAAWQKTLSVVVYRKPVHHETKKNYQLDLFDPDDGYFEYSAVGTNLDLRAPLRSGILWPDEEPRKKPSLNSKANGPWMSFRLITMGPTRLGSKSAILGHNLLRNFQLQTLATPKPRSRKRTYCFFPAKSKNHSF